MSIHSWWRCVNSFVLLSAYFCLLLNSFASLSVIVADSFYPQISESHTLLGLSLDRKINKSEANGLRSVSQGQYCLKERTRVLTRAAVLNFWGFIHQQVQLGCWVVHIKQRGKSYFPSYVGVWVDLIDLCTTRNIHNIHKTVLLNLGEWVLVQPAGSRTAPLDRQRQTTTVSQGRIKVIIC